LNTLHFKYAIEVDRTCSISQAAENLYMGQPSLSKAIKELEDSLGYVIFERTTKGVTTTQKGKEFLSYARNILIQIEKMESLSDTASKNTQNFNISIPRGSYIADAITSFLSQIDNNKGINVNIQETNSKQVVNNILDGPFNLGIIRYQLEYENYILDYLKEKRLKYETIWEYDYLVLMSDKHPVAQKEKIEQLDLKGYIEITHGDTAIPYFMHRGNIKLKENVDSGKHIYVYDRCSQYDLLTSISTAYMWVSPIPEKWLQRYHLVQRKCKVSGNRYKDVFIYPTDYKFTELDREFINKLSEEKNKVSFHDYK
jgi:DNA-binding transcriptional LysR family regulator